MAKQGFISHVVNGYSRYDVPESKAFSMTPGLLYPARIQFINARDRVKLSQGIDVRSNPLAVPTFNPYTVRLHRFWVPLQLYHPEMRTNASLFDMHNLSINWIPSYLGTGGSGGTDQHLGTQTAYPNSLLAWLRAFNTKRYSTQVTGYNTVALPASSNNYYYSGVWSNADTYLAYWDIVRNYYAYSNWSVYSYAWPASWGVSVSEAPSNTLFGEIYYKSDSCYFNQRFGNLQYLDTYYESQFYPNAVTSSNNTFNRSNLFYQIVLSDMASEYGGANGGNTVYGLPVTPNCFVGSEPGPDDQLVTEYGSGVVPSTLQIFAAAHPLAVVPSSPDRFSRLVPPGTTSSSVSMTGVTTIPQLAVASRLQEYKDLLGVGGNRYSDWLETFFAAKIEHVDRPKLLFSASQTVNAQVVINQNGNSAFQSGSALGAQGGTIAFNSALGREQSYYFTEPGYLIDMISIRPVYYWSGVRPDYLDYEGSDYFNPIYNDIGYQNVNPSRLGFFLTGGVTPVYYQEPCFNEFRASYDEVLGQLSSVSAYSGSTSLLYSYWVQQRDYSSIQGQINPSTYVAMYSTLFCDMSTVNSPFASNVEDNFFVNLSYSVSVKNLVNKSFATRLSNR